MPRRNQRQATGRFHNPEAFSRRNSSAPRQRITSESIAEFGFYFPFNIYRHLKVEPSNYNAFRAAIRAASANPNNPNDVQFPSVEEARLLVLSKAVINNACRSAGIHNRHSPNEIHERFKKYIQFSCKPDAIATVTSVDVIGYTDPALIATLDAPIMAQEQSGFREVLNSVGADVPVGEFGLHWRIAHFAGQHAIGSALEMAQKILPVGTGLLFGRTVFEK